MKYDLEDRFLAPALDQNPALIPTIAGALPEQPMRIALVGCFRPRQCGIATYTADIFDHLRREHPEIAIDLVAMATTPEHASDPSVSTMLEESNRAAYRIAAETLNAAAVDLVWIQHEFGIYGGEAGDMVLDLVDRVAAPIVVTLHTVLADPGDAQRRVMDRLIATASHIIVMGAHARDTLIETYGANAAAVSVIEHGTPDRPFVARSPLREALGLGDRPILSTFGLLGSGKGLETAIRALPAIAAHHPDILYRIVGATHPNLIAAEGERYREGLQALADSLGVGKNIAWDNRFLDADDLLDQIEMCDVYVAPYPNLAQVTSGTLAYAVALGRAIVSTPFVHAKELLADDVGVLVPQNDSDAIAAAVLDLLAAPEHRRAVQSRAYARGRRTAWPTVIGETAALLRHVAGARATTSKSRRAAPALTGLWTLCDDVGMLQHARGIVPDRDHGYCIDDNARALMLFNRLPQTPRIEQQHLRFASFVQHGWSEEVGAFRNFMGYDRSWLEKRGSDDSNGRALWALGDTAGITRSASLANWARERFHRAADNWAEVRSPRAVAFATLGAAALLKRFEGDGRALRLVTRGAECLANLTACDKSEWRWIEPTLAYDNARIPEAMIRAGERLGNAGWTAQGLALLAWLCDRQTSAAGRFRPIGSDGFGLPGETLPFDQQPLEAWATIDACAAAYEATGASRWRDYAVTAYGWFFGDNDRDVALANIDDGRCCDGLTRQGVNLNVGAESILAFHLAYHAMATLFWRDDAREVADIADADLQT